MFSFQRRPERQISPGKKTFVPHLDGRSQEKQVAEVLGASAITVKRDWKAARAWWAAN
jgi:hypothetical protein